jgi:hypothetical protein
MAAITWAAAVSGDFDDPANWAWGVTPGADDEAILDAAGDAPYTVTDSDTTTVSAIQTAANATLDVSGWLDATDGTGSGVNAGSLWVLNGGTMTLQGTVDNTGVIYACGETLQTTILIGAAGVTLTGGGPVIMDFTGGPYQQIVGATPTTVLTDVDDRISGQGVLGGGSLIIDNEAEGFLEAKGGLLVIDTGANTIANAGLIDAEGLPANLDTPGHGVVESPVDNTGTLEADGRGANLTLEDAVTGSGMGVIAGGTLQFDAAFNQDVDFVGESDELVLTRSQGYTRTLYGFSLVGGDYLDLRDIGFVGPREATVSRGAGKGEVLKVTDGTHTAEFNLGDDYYLDVSFIAASDGAGGTLITDTTPLHWLDPVSADFGAASDWTGGVTPGADDDAILDAAGDTPYAVAVSGATTVGSIQTAATATLEVAGAFTAIDGTGSGVNAGTISVAGGATCALGGIVDNRGALILSGSGAASTLIIESGGASLTGGGVVTLGGASAVVEGASLTNVDDAIQGAGRLGDGALTLINQAKGVIDADAASPLVVDTAGETLVNAGLIEATAAGGIEIRRTSVDGSGGGVIAAAGGAVLLQGADVAGGALRSAGGVAVRVQSGDDVLDGTASPVTNLGRLVIDNGQTLNARGAIDNAGLICLDSEGAAATLIVGAAGLTLSGGGDVRLSAHPANLITGASAAATLTNAGDVIEGAGSLGGGRMTLVNDAGGVICDWLAVALAIDTGARTIVNAGLIEASGRADVTVRSPIDNTGVLEADGGTLSVTGAVTGTGRAALDGGTLAFDSTFAESVDFAGAAGVLVLTRPGDDSGTISGFGDHAGQFLDLADIGFVGAGEATFKPAAAGGVLTVADGTHAARLTLAGDYRGWTFTASSDGHGGTLVTAFAQALAAMGPAPAAATPGAEVSRSPAPLLATPKTG